MDLSSTLRSGMTPLLALCVTVSCTPPQSGGAGSSPALAGNEGESAPAGENANQDPADGNLDQAAAPDAGEPPMGPIGGIYELGFGTRDLAGMIAYWKHFGFTEGPRGELSAAQAKALYGVDSRLTSVRMTHQDADHGLVRVMVWDRPVNDGLGMRTMRVRGNRWGAMLTDDVLRASNHAEVAKKQGRDVKSIGPLWAVIYDQGDKFEPFRDKQLGVREFFLVRPETRQLLFQRFGYSLAHYGKVNPDVLFPTSQFTHMGMIIHADDNRVLRFYDEVLGLMRVRDTEGESSYEKSVTGRQVFELRPGERYYSTDFDDPRSSRTELAKVRSGRLKIIRFPKSQDLEQGHHLSRPGSLGLSLYTYPVRDIAAYHAKVSRSAASGAAELTASNITAIAVNEFGERSFSFIAPDGYFWTLVEKRPR